MHDDGQGVHGLAVEQDVQTHQVGLAVVDGLVVHAGVAARAGLEPVEEVIDDLGEGQLVGHHHAVGGQVVQVLLGAALVLAELHDVAHVFVGHVDVHAHIGLVKGLDLG